MPGGGKGGGASSTVTVHNGPISVDADSTVEIVGLDKINVTARLEPSPLKTESRQEIVLPQPLRTESKLDLTSKSELTTDSTNAMSVDLKPVALDVCLNTKLPQGQICQPFSFHLGLTLYGMEVFGVNFGGESRTLMQEVPRVPAVEWPAQQHAPARSAADRTPASAPGDRGFVVRIT